MNGTGQIGPTGDLIITLNKAQRPNASWRFKNILLPGHMRSALLYSAAKGFSNLSGALTIVSQLNLVHYRLKRDAYKAYDKLRTVNTPLDELKLFMLKNSLATNYGVVSRRVVTDAGVAFIVDDWDNSATDITNLNYHGVGTGTNAEAVGDTALQTESTTILNPDSTRATGTKSQPAANQLRTVGTILFDGAGAITEHGVLSQAATGGGTLWDRSVFSAVNVVSADSIQATYTCTINSGG